jgi:hypothetical protein
MYEWFFDYSVEPAYARKLLFFCNGAWHRAKEVLFSQDV